MSDKTRNSHKAQSALRATTDAQVAALNDWHLADPDGLAATIAAIGKVCDDLRADPEVAAHASLIVGGYRARATSPAMAAAAAVSQARKVVASAHALEAWVSDEAPDMIEEVAGDPGRVGTLARYAPAPDAPFRWHAGDIVQSLTSVSPRLSQVCTEWRRHEAEVQDARQTGEVARCGCGDHLAHRVTLQGISAHVAGLSKDDSGYWSTYRATRAQLAGARATFAREGLAGDPDPMGDAHPRTTRATTGDRTPVTTAHPEVCEGVTVNGVTRPLTPLEAQAITGRIRHAGPVCESSAPEQARGAAILAGLNSCTHDSCGRIRGDHLARASRRPDHGGEWGSVQTRPALDSIRFAHARPVDGRAVTPGEGVASGAVPVSPRKRARTGSTGPTTTAW